MKNTNVRFFSTCLLFFSLVLSGGRLLAQDMEVPPQLSDVPTVYIDVYDGKAITSKVEWHYATYREVDKGKLTVYDSLRIRGRGNSTWGLEKKPYRLKFNEKVRLLGKGRANAKNWVMMANHADKTLLRNATASFIGSFLGQPFTPGYRFVDLVLNGTYIGNYQITDHLDIRKNRIDIVEQEDPATAESDITGGYLLEFDGFYTSSAVHFTTNRGAPVSVHSPDEDVINADQMKYITGVVQQLENALYSSRYRDAERGYRALVDTTTLASWFVASEYTANPDAFWSTYAYKNAQDPLIYWGPMWDYDIAFNNCNRCGDVTNRTITDYAFGSGVILPWAKQLCTDPWFQRLVARTWREASEAGICDATLAFVDSMAQVIDQSQRLNFERYSLTHRVYNELTLYSTYQEGVDHLKRFVRQHAAYLDQLYDVQKAPEPIQLGQFDTDSYYQILNLGNFHPVDVDDDKVCTWEADDARLDTQTWQFIPGVDDGYYLIVNKESGLAITDVASWTGGEYEKGQQLRMDIMSLDNAAQEWCFVPTSGNWVIENRETGLAWNNRSGGSANGNNVMSWYNNEENAKKATRQWVVKATESIKSDIAEAEADAPEYRVIYDQDTRQLLLIQPYGQQLDGTISVYTAAGKLVVRGSINAPLDMTAMPQGIYLVKWTVGGYSRSAKLRT